LKERLNIDCLRMLCEEESPEDPDAQLSKGPPAGGYLNQSLSMNDSYHVLMREIGVEGSEGLSKAFLNKNGQA